jgi:hypothetical protein
MKTASLNEVRKSLNSLTNKELIEICLRMAKYKKDNKELFTYLLYYSGDEQGYINSVKEEVNRLLNDINRSNSYYAMKGIRKSLRLTNRFIRYSGIKQTEVELLMHFCNRLKVSGIPIHSTTALNNLYQRQLMKIRKAIASLHEDLQFDYGEEMKRLGL